VITRADLTLRMAIASASSRSVGGKPCCFRTFQLTTDFASVMMLALITWDFSYRQLAIDMFPDVEMPVISIVTKYPAHPLRQWNGSEQTD